MASFPAHEHVPEGDQISGDAGGDASAAGKRSRTQSIGPSITSLADRVATVLQRRAEAQAPRDDNGVAAGAETAVDHAASSAGAPLPTHIQRTFEGSLGADLSGVRIHTGSESAAAASAVGAQAYTTGNDIHFAAGKYQPDDPFGMHLIAHEVAHTVQQAGAGAPARQHKLEVSTPGDAHEVEADAAADAMVRGEPATVSGAGGVARTAIQRTGESAGPTPMPGDGSAPSPFDYDKLPEPTREQIERITLEQMRALVGLEVGRAYTEFIAACVEVKAQLKEDKKKRQEDEQKWVDVAIAVAGLAIAGPLGGGAAVSRAAPKLRAGVTAGIRGKLGNLLVKGGVAPAEARSLQQLAIDKVASKAVDDLIAKKLSGDGASDLLSGAIKTAMAFPLHVDLNGSDEDKAVSYVDAVMRSAGPHRHTLDAGVIVCEDAGTLVDIYHQFSSASLGVYRAQMYQRGKDFVTQISSTAGDGAKDMIVEINAYGRNRLATVHHTINQGRYHFKSWVSPSMEPMARQLHGSFAQVLPEHCEPHVPDPVDEGNIYGQETIRTVNAYGKERLVVVKADKGFIINHYGELHFVRWVPEDTESQLMAYGQAASQAAGAAHLDPAKIKGLKAPPPPRAPATTPGAPTPASPPTHTPPLGTGDVHGDDGAPTP